MRWGPLQVVQAPVGDLPLAEVRSFLSIPADKTCDDALLNRLRRAVVSDAEFYLRRAIFAQTRMFDGRAGAWEPARHRLTLEPVLSGVTVTAAGAAQTGFDVAGDTVYFADPGLMLDDGDVLSVRYTAGYPPGGLPADLLAALLSEVQRRYERRTATEGAEGSRPLVKLIDTGALSRYRAYNEPLNADLVVGGAPWD